MLSPSSDVFNVFFFGGVMFFFNYKAIVIVQPYSEMVGWGTGKKMLFGFRKTQLKMGSEWVYQCTRWMS